METKSGAPALRPPPSARAGQSSWIVSPAFDLFFLANLWWLLAFVPSFVAPEGTVHLKFWQLYFITTPHRWITLGLVALDPDRREGRTRLFLWLAAVVFVCVWGVKLLAGNYFWVLVVADYIWNGWHFASQHHGVLRIYGKKVGGGWPLFERDGLRLFIFFVILQTGAWTIGCRLEDYPRLAAVARAADLAVLTLPVLLLATAWFSRTPGSGPKLTYLASVCGIYSALLLAIYSGNSTLVLALAVSTAAFHAVEYLAIVTNYAWHREKTGSIGLFRKMAGRWVGVLAAFLIFLGLSDYALSNSIGEWWYAMNVWAAFMHYTYDGMIWKLRRPATAQALGIQVPTSDAIKAGHPLTSQRSLEAIQEVGS